MSHWAIETEAPEGAA